MMAEMMTETSHHSKGRDCLLSVWRSPSCLVGLWSAASRQRVCSNVSSMLRFVHCCCCLLTPFLWSNSADSMLAMNRFTQQLCQRVGTKVAARRFAMTPICRLNEKKMPFNAVQIELSAEDSTGKEFEESLVASLSRWQSEGSSAAWIKVPEAAASAVEVAARHGFSYHHAEHGTAMLCRWLGNTAPCIVLLTSPTHSLPSECRQSARRHVASSSVCCFQSLDVVVQLLGRAEFPHMPPTRSE